MAYDRQLFEAIEDHIQSDPSHKIELEKKVAVDLRIALMKMYTQRMVSCSHAELLQAASVATDLPAISNCLSEWLEAREILELWKDSTTPLLATTCNGVICDSCGEIFENPYTQGGDREGMEDEDSLGDVERYSSRDLAKCEACRQKKVPA